MARRGEGYGGRLAGLNYQIAFNPGNSRNPKFACIKIPGVKTIPISKSNYTQNKRKHLFINQIIGGINYSYIKIFLQVTTWATNYFILKYQGSKYFHINFLKFVYLYFLELYFCNMFLFLSTIVICVI